MPDETTPSPEPDPSEQPTTQAPQPDAEAPRPDPQAPRKLLRSRDDRVLGGVCGGLAKYFNIDPLIVRIAAVALVFLGGVSIIAYIAALLLVPDDDGTGHPVPGKPGRVSTLVGAVVIVLAGVALLNGAWGPSWGWAFGALGPIAIVVVILAIAGQRLLASRGDRQPAAGRIVGAALLIGGVGLGLLALAGAGAIATAAGGGTAIAGVVVALGVAMIALAFRDGGGSRARWLVLPALALAVPSSVVTAAGIDTSHGVGSRHYAPATIADIKPGGYELGVGELEIDLRRMAWPATSTVHLKIDVGTGHALVLVPEGTCVEADTHAGLGYVDVLGDDDGGADVDETKGTVTRNAGRRLVLDADMGIGAIEVLHTKVRDWDHHREQRDAITPILADAGCAGTPA
ncbi:MAG TPA: PspC domain-containing protein [Baekduia sp.]